NDDHPHADIRLGQQFISEVVNAFIDSPQWTRGALFINYDEWGGFFDTSAPPQVADERAAQGFDQLGFRVPAAVISPFATGGLASHTYDHTSILKFIEWRYGLGNLTMRDAAARNIGEVLDFSIKAARRDKPEIRRYVAPPEAREGCSVHEAPVPVSDLTVMRDAGIFDALGMRTDYRFEDSFRSF
ncbi:MAG: alkaline phosphatase family protein, partial [Acidimicrobiia bacterium]